MTQAEARKAGCEWALDVYVHGHYAGTDYHPTEAEARADAEERRARFRVLGFVYHVRPLTTDH